MDDIDRATKEIDQQTNVALANIRAEQKMAQAIPSASECVECGELIPSERQVAVPGCQLCIHCANQIEATVRGQIS